MTTDTKVSDLNDPEIMLNVWYVHDELGIVYSLRARAYVGIGTDEEKLEMLRRFALIDYLIAQPFPVPERFHMSIVEDGAVRRMPVVPAKILRDLPNRLSLFEDAIRQLERQLPAQTKLTIPSDPLVCTTPLRADDKGDIRPVFAETERL